MASLDASGCPASSEQWIERIPLPNGLSFYLPSRIMRGAASFLITEIFRRNRYARPGFELHPSDTVVDVGANMGLFTLWAAPQVPQGRVLAIEPTNVIDCLTLNVQLNGLTNVIPLKAAVSRSEQSLEFIEYPGFNIVTHQANARPALITRLLIRLLYGRYHQEPVRVTVSSAPLAKILDDFQLPEVNFLKMDCEGGEYEIFRGMSRECWQRIERIALEFHELRRDQRHGELVSCLREAGFEVDVRRKLLDYYFMRFGEIWAQRQRDVSRSSQRGLRPQPK